MPTSILPSAPSFRKGRRTSYCLIANVILVAFLALPAPSYAQTTSPQPTDRRGQAAQPILRGQDYSRIPPPVPSHSRARWQVHFNVSTSFPNYRYWSNGTNYQRVPATESEARFVLPSGEVINAASTAEQPPKSVVKSDRFFRAGLSRQTHWGGLVRLSAGYYRNRFYNKEVFFDNLGAQEVRSWRDISEDAVPLELGFQYTFLRRHRIRPYLGVSVLTFLYYAGESAELFLDGASGQQGFVERFTIRDLFPVSSDFALTAGVQYELSERLSVGAFVWSNSGVDIWVDAPVGVEVRYDLWQKQWARQ